MDEFDGERRSDCPTVGRLSTPGVASVHRIGNNGRLREFTERDYVLSDFPRHFQFPYKPFKPKLVRNLSKHLL